MGEKKKIFVGAYGGAGTRVVMDLLKKGGYYIGEPYVNEPYDFRGKSKTFVKSFDTYWTTKNDKPLRDLLKTGTDGHNSWALKHGQLMFIQDELKKWYPNSVFIYVMRNPVDNAMNQYFDPNNNFIAHHKYGGLPVNSTVIERANYCIQQSKIAMSKADYVVTLEELCNNKDYEVERLLKFANIEFNDIKEYSSRIITPKSMGRGSKLYNQVDLSLMDMKPKIAESKVEINPRFKVEKQSTTNLTNKVLFVRIPKTASITTNTILTTNRLKFKRDFGHHYTRYIKSVIGEQTFNGLYKFVIVRNPWDKLWSSYNFIRNGSEMHHVSSNIDVDFKTHLQNIKNSGLHLETKSRTHGVNNNYHKQRNWVFDSNGNQLVDDVFKFEELETAYKIIEGKTGVKLTGQLQKIHKNKTKKTAHYKDVYDDEMIELVREMYADDIETFGYEF